MRALIAIGGNSLVRPGERGTINEQLVNLQATAQNIALLIKRGWSVVLTHGNGPQVGAELLRSERASAEVYSLPLDVCVASTQSEIGYLLQRTLRWEFKKIGLKKDVITVVTEVRVDEHDRAFQTPTKPIGPLYTKKVAAEREVERGWSMVEDEARGYRRVVPSPEPLEIIQRDIIAKLLGEDVVVIALGGGGIPVVRREDGSLEGIEAVIDKDRASALLASSLEIDYIFISTDVERVFLDYRKPTERPICRAHVGEMEKYLLEGHFSQGSMRPKIESAIRFLRNGGKEVVITSLEKLVDGVDGRTGTHIVP